MVTVSQRSQRSTRSLRKPVPRARPSVCSSPSPPSNQVPVSWFLACFDITGSSLATVAVRCAVSRTMYALQPMNEQEHLVGEERCIPSMSVAVCTPGASAVKLVHLSESYKPQVLSFGSRTWGRTLSQLTSVTRTGRISKYRPVRIQKPNKQVPDVAWLHARSRKQSSARGSLSMFLMLRQVCRAARHGLLAVAARRPLRRVHVSDSIGISLSAPCRGQSCTAC